MEAKFEAQVIRKVTMRIIPFIMLLYFVNFLDRVNAGFAALSMNKAIGLTPAMFGFGGSLFAVGYFIFEVPSNLILVKVGARVWIARVMVTWGVVSMAFAFVSGPTGFYVLRLLLGIAEAGFFPGVILYLGFWFPARQRAAATALFMAAAPISGVIGSPISGLLMELPHFAGLSNWQWLFIVEGLPSVDSGPSGAGGARGWAGESRLALARGAWLAGEPAGVRTRRGASQSHPCRRHVPGAGRSPGAVDGPHLYWPFDGKLHAGALGTDHHQAIWIFFAGSRHLERYPEHLRGHRHDCLGQAFRSDQGTDMARRDSLLSSHAPA